MERRASAQLAELRGRSNTGANERRWIGDGPKRASAMKCSAVQ